MFEKRMSIVPDSSPISGKYSDHTQVNTRESLFGIRAGRHGSLVKMNTFDDRVVGANIRLHGRRGKGTDEPLLR